jgi:prepilin-type N-terminal cleavage/methylation domain-containing protein
LKVINNKSKIARVLASRNASVGGFTLPEVMVSVAITVVLALGTLCYQYQGVKHSRNAQAQVTATRIGQILLEDWKSTRGDADYDPQTLGLGFVATETGEFGDYRIMLDNQTFYMQLEHIDRDYDAVAGITLREISVTVKWRRDFTRGIISSSDPSICLTTYVRRDG